MEVNNNYFKVENNVAEALARINLSEYETRLLWVVMRKTWGWNKEEDHISFTQFEKATGINRGNAHPALLRLTKKNIIKVLRERRTNTYSVNKNTDIWIYETKKNVIATKNMATNNSMPTNNKSLLPDTTIPLFVETNTKDKENTTKQKTNNILENNNSLFSTPKSPINQTPIQKLVAYYQKLYMAKFNQEPAISPTSWGKWGKLLKVKLTQGYTLREIAILLHKFANSKDSDAERLGFDLGVFFSDTIFNKMKALNVQSKSNSGLEDKYGKWK